MTDEKERTEVVVHEGTAPVAEVNEVSGFIQLAIEKDIDVEKLGMLLDLDERVAGRNARNAFFAALGRVQEKLPEIKKTKEASIATRGGSGYSYTFAPLDEIVRVVRPILREEGFSFAWSTDPPAGGVLYVICILRHIDGHEERSSFPVEVDTQAKMSGAQKYGAALTYGKRQSLTSVLGIVTTDDIDGADMDACISEEQVADLQALIDEIKADESIAFDEAAFYAWLGVAHLEAVKVGQYDGVVHDLERKRRGE